MLKDAEKMQSCRAELHLSCIAIAVVIALYAAGKQFGFPGSRSSIPGAVAERRLGLRRHAARHAGGMASENAGMSSDKECERHSRRKSKGSCLKLI